MSSRKQSARTVRIVGGLLSIVWLGAGIAAIVIGLSASRYLLAVVGIPALLYGLVWFRVTRVGRLLTVR